MASTYYTFVCICGEPVEVELELITRGSSGSYWEPGEGAEWQLARDVASCPCGANYPHGWLYTHHDAAMDEAAQLRDVEPDYEP